MTPREAARHLVRNNVDYLPLDELEGRIATTLFVVYPPGIATIVPGERLGARARPMIDYLKMFEQSANLLSRLRGRDPGPLSRGRRARRDPLLHLCGQSDAPSSASVAGKQARVSCADWMASAMTPRRRVPSIATSARRSRTSVRAPSRDGRRAGDARDLSASHPRAASIRASTASSKRPTPTTSSAAARTMHNRKMPHLVAEQAANVVGYAYAVPFRKRPAYRYTVKHSIYVRSDRLHARHRAPAAGRADRRLRRGGLSPDDRLYRRRQRGLDQAA